MGGNVNVTPRLREVYKYVNKRRKHVSVHIAAKEINASVSQYYQACKLMGKSIKKYSTKKASKRKKREEVTTIVPSHLAELVEELPAPMVLQHENQMVIAIVGKPGAVMQALRNFTGAME